jgi:hypothetical protein
MNSSQLKSYLTGLILGDAHIDNGVQARALRLKTINEDWANKIYLDISKNTNFKIFLLEHDGRVDSNNVNHKKNWEVYIKAHPYFAKIYHYFYNDHRERKISTESLKDLDWNGWANWYLSDGYIVRVGLESGIIKDRRVQLCTDRYSLKDIEKLQKFMFNSLNIDTTIIKRIDAHRLNIRLNSAQEFFLNIQEYVPQSMQYKLNMCYDYRPKWMSDNYFSLMNSIKSAEHSETE